MKYIILIAASLFCFTSYADDSLYEVDLSSESGRKEAQTTLESHGMTKEEAATFRDLASVKEDESEEHDCGSHK